MLIKTNMLLGIDVGERRIGLALADESIRIAVPYDTIEVDGNEVTAIFEIINHEQIDTLVVGYPRNQAGEPTKQTAYVEQFMKQFSDSDAALIYQDESLTSVIAEERLQSYGKPYKKGDVDSVAASIILQDYLEQQYA